MRNRYRIYVRGKKSGGKVWMIQDNQTGKRESLRTTDKQEALEMLLLRNRPCQQAGFHAQMARTHLLVSNPQNADRTWQSVMDSIISKKTGATQIRWQRAANCEPFDHIRNLKVPNTSSDDFDKVLNAGGVSVNVYLRRLHNYALDMNWLLAPVERSRYAAVQTGPLRLRTWQAGGLVLHWPLTEPSTGCRRFARHEAGQTININL